MAQPFFPRQMRRAVFLSLFCAVFSLGIAAGGEAENEAETSRAAVLERLRRLAEAGQHVEVIAECETLLALPSYGALWEALAENGKTLHLPTGEPQALEGELAEIFFLRGQSAMALAGGNAERLQRLAEEWEEAANRFGRMRRPRRVAEAHYQAARALWLAGKPRPARDILARLQKQRMPANLEADACRLLAEAILALAQEVEAKAAAGKTSGRSAQRQRDALYEEALNPLRRIAMYCASSPHHGWAESTLIETLMRLGRYQEAAGVADGFLRREVQRSALRARVLARRAECSRQLGDIETAARLFREVLESNAAEEEVRRDALCGLGWCYGHLSRLARAEPRQRFLRQGRTALADALAALSAADERRPSLTHLLAEIALEEGDLKEAENLAASLLGDPAWRFRAAYLRSQILRRSGQLVEGSAQLQRLLRWPPAAESDIQIQQKALRGLGEIALAAKDDAAAFLWFKRAGEEARRWRDEEAIAEAELGAAKALIALAQGAAARPPQAVRLLIPYMNLALGGAEAIETLTFSLQAWRMERAAGPADLKAAIEILDRLTRRYAAYIRHDEIAYWRGQTIMSQAAAAHAAAASEDDVVRLYKDAAAAFAAAVSDNPLSPWALSSGILMAEAQQRQARFLFDRAAQWQRQNAHTEAQIRIAAGKKALADALQTLGQCLTLPGSAEQQARARQLRGEVYFDLEEFDKAAQEFEELARQSDLGISWQCQAARQWSAALERQGKREEAVRPLLPYVHENAQAAIQAGLLWEALERWPKAHEAYLAGLAAKSDAMARAEASYRLHMLELRHAGQLRPQAGDETRRMAIRGLEEIVSSHPRTPWAVEALLAAGEWHLPREPGEALRLAASAISGGDIYPPLKQAAKFLAGTALLGLGRPKEALQALQEAEALPAEDMRGRLLRAAAIRGQGDAMLRLADRQTAMRHYGRVLADYPEVEDIAEPCRASLAKCLAEEGKMEEALRLLEAGKSRPLMQQTREELLKRQGAPAGGGK